ncbi:MAG TPA: hypothetical protein VMR46_04080 [Candidatus Paceibacterota bacterium]|nr:hypothetical protein [Candidatus Paceibacterota bacterium]
MKEITDIYPKSRLTRLVCRAEYLYRRHWENRPLPFAFVSSDRGKAVGDSIDIDHLRLHDMMEHEARGQLTEQVLLKGLRANAFSVVRTQGTNLQGRTTIQPRWI